MKQIIAVTFIATLSLAAAPQANDAEALYQQGRDALTRGEPAKAVEYLEKAVALKPNHAAYHYQLGNAYGQSTASASMFKMMSLAKRLRAEYEKAVQLDPNVVPARFGLVEFYVNAPSIAGGSEASAITQANEIRKRDAIDGHRAFARIHAAAKKAELVRKEYADMLEEQPNSARAHYWAGVYQMLTEKNYKAANDEFESTAKLDPSYMPAYFQIGHVAALAANNFGRGEETLKKYLGYKPKEEEPSIARACYWLGAVYEKQGKKAEAKSQYVAALELNPNQKDAAEAMKRL